MERELKKLEEEEEKREMYNNDNEKKKVDDLRVIVERQDPACKDVDDLTLRRFLRAHDHDMEKASRMFMKYHEWRRMFVPEGSISESEVQNQIAHDKVFMQGKDKRGSPVAVIFGAKHFPSKGQESAEEFKRFVVFAFDKLCSRIPNGQEKFTIIADLKGYSYSNVDVQGYLAGISILQDYYPERLRKLLFVHAPYIFMTAYKIVYPFIDKNIKKEIVFVENKKIKSTLLEEIDEDELPQIYGGKLQLVPIQDA